MSVSGEVLYVDDDAGNLVVFEAAYSSDLPVLTARGGAEALELLRAHDVAVVLSDQRMPGMTGVDLLETARQDYPNAVRMLVTAYSDLDAAVGAINRGHVHYYFRKPWEPLELKLVLVQARDSYLAKRRLSDLERRLVETERLYALGVVAAGVAHEIRNPLTALSMNLEVVRMHTEDIERPQINAALNDAMDAVRSIAEITNSIELSTRSREDTEVDLAEVVRLAARSVQGEMRKRGRLELQVGEVPLVRGSRTRLGQVALNLLVNALEAFDPTKWTDNVLRVVLSAEGTRVELTVSDNGPGIDTATLARIFDPFFTTKKAGGTGLGLAISRQIVEELSGTLEVESTVGKGTTFRARLPAAG